MYIIKFETAEYTHLLAIIYSSIETYKECIKKVEKNQKDAYVIGIATEERTKDFERSKEFWEKRIETAQSLCKKFEGANWYDDESKARASVRREVEKA